MAQLNSLLFSVHGLNDKSLELNIQGQLAAIYTRLQEIVAMINVAKKKEVKTKSETISSPDNKQPCQPPSDEQKINKKLEEYQRALYQSSQTSEMSGQNRLNILATQTSSQPLKVEVHTRKSCDEGPVPGLGSHHARRRTSKDRQMLTGDAGPPTEKKARSNQENGSRANSPQPTSSTKSKSGGKGKILLENILDKNSGNISKDRVKERYKSIRIIFTLYVIKSIKH